MTGNRIDYIDSMRGFAIICVLIGHVLLFVIANKESFWFNLVDSFQMPLFFFISGLMAYSTRKNKQHEFWSKINGKFLNIFLPTIVTGGLYIIIFQCDLWAALVDQYKYGYWFTWVLFELFVIYYVIEMLVMRFKSAGGSFVWILIGISLLSYIAKSVLFRLNSGIDDSWLFNLLSMNQVMTYLKFFCFGVIAKIYMPRFLRLIDNNIIVLMACLAFAAMHLLMHLFSLKNYTILTIAQFSSIIVIYRLFYVNRHLFSINTRTGNLMSFIGRHTLQIYFLHYFFLEGLKGLSSLDIMAPIADNFTLEIAVSLILSSLLVALSLLLDKSLRAFPPLYAAMFGTKYMKRSDPQPKET